MAKTDTQSIPAELLDPYKTTLTEQYSWKNTSSVRKRIRFIMKTLRDWRSRLRTWQ